MIRETRSINVLKPQDIMALVGLQVMLRSGEGRVTLPRLAAFIRLSGSETHAALSRLELSQLLAATALELRKPSCGNFLEFAEHGLRYVYPAEYGPPTRGLPTAAALMPGLVAPDQPLVWPSERGGSCGPSVTPLYRTVPEACASNKDLHVAMAALDCLRVGRARERQAGLAVLMALFTP